MKVCTDRRLHQCYLRGKNQKYNIKNYYSLIKIIFLLIPRIELINRIFQQIILQKQPFNQPLERLKSLEKN